MKKILILLLAILAIAAVAYFCIYENRIPSIEKDLSFRSQNKLNNQEMSWARVKVDGRNLTLTGVAPSEKLRDDAMHVANVNGVNFIDNQLTVVDDANNISRSMPHANELDDSAGGNYSLNISNISKNDAGKLLVEGVMSAAMHQKVVEAVTAKIGVDQLVDHIVDKEVETPKELPAIATTMLARVVALEDGQARLAGKQLVVSGSTPTEEAVEQIKQQTAKGLPKGFTSSFNLTPPKAVADSALASPSQERKIAVASTPRRKKIKQFSSKKCQQKLNKVLAESKIYFTSSSAVIKKSSYKVLNKLASVASRCTSHKINVHGHTDITGRNKLNQRLSKKRAQAVADYLAKKGVNPKYIHAVGHGSKKPIASNNTSAGRARNRRIELTVED
ncbi:MAG TPA: BON domain-containing protein [Thiothrix sp.]|nr:BON domain-containing protein [Thiothrix sp.]